MRKNMEQELHRLERELLKEEEKERTARSVPDLPEGWESLADDTQTTEELTAEIRKILNKSEIPQIEATNTDRTDVDLELYSEDVRNPKKRTGCLGCLLRLILILLLLGALGAAVLYWMVKTGRLT